MAARALQSYYQFTTTWLFVTISLLTVLVRLICQIEGLYRRSVTQNCIDHTGTEIFLTRWTDCCRQHHLKNIQSLPSEIDPSVDLSVSQAIVAFKGI